MQIIFQVFNIRFFGEHIGKFFYKLVDDNIKTREEKSIVRPDVIHLLMQARKGNLKQESDSNVLDAGFSVVQEFHQGKLITHNGKRLCSSNKTW